MTKRRVIATLIAMAYGLSVGWLLKKANTKVARSLAQWANEPSEFSSLTDD